MKRRDFLAGSAGALALLQAGTWPGLAQAAPAKAGRLKQSVARWCFDSIPMELFCQALQEMGITGMDLVAPADWDMCKRYGITPCMVLGGGGRFEPVPAGSKRRYGPAFGWDKLEHHATLLKNLELVAGVTGKAKLPNIIGLFGDREGLSDDEGIHNCVVGLKQAVPILEKNNVRMCIEVLNSLVDHPDYIGNHTLFGVEVCKQVGSEQVKLVYDAYHMQIMEGNLISTIRDNIDYIAHIHLAGVPGRHEIDDSQEVNWHAVAKAIADLYFKGYVAHEWIPTGKDPLVALRKAVKILTV